MKRVVAVVFLCATVGSLLGCEAGPGLAAHARSSVQISTAPNNSPGSSADLQVSTVLVDSVGVELAPVSRPETPFVAPMALPDSVDAAPSIQQGGALSATRSRPGETLELGQFRLINNVWGAPSDETLSSGVYSETDGSFGWYWDRQQPMMKSGEAHVLPIYPNVRIGGSPWEASRSAIFPVRARDIKSLTFDVSFEYPAIPTGACNLAYDIFFTETSAPSATPVIKAEVMIWILGTATEPEDRYKGDFTDGHNTYALYSWAMSNGRQYYAFVMKPGSAYQARHTVDAGKLLDSVPLQPDWWMPGVELGTEVWHGTGKIQVGQFGIELNGAEVKSF